MPMAMFNDPEEIDTDIASFMSAVDDDALGINDYYNSWFSDTASMMLLTHRHYKRKNYADAYGFAQDIAAPDWRIACL
jgi:hypothetical protein